MQHSGEKLNPICLEIGDGKPHTFREIVSPVLSSVQYQSLCCVLKCRTIAVTASIQQDTVSALRINAKRKSYKCMINFP